MTPADLHDLEAPDPGGTPVYRPAAWALTMWRRPTQDETDAVWEPCIALWLPPTALDTLLGLLRLSRPGDATEGSGDPFDGRMIEPVGIAVIPTNSDQPPIIRCFLPDPVDADLDALAVDLPAAVALTAALANHNDDTWHFPIVLASGNPLPAGEPLPVHQAAVAIMLDQNPLAESIAGAVGMPTDFGDTTVGPLTAAFGDHALAVRGEAWAVIAGLTCGHEISVQRLLMHARLLADVGHSLADFQPSTPGDRLATVREAAEHAPGGATGLSMLTNVALLHSAAIEAVSVADLSDPVSEDLAVVIRRAHGSEPGARTVTSGALDHVDERAWAELAAAAHRDPMGWMEVGTHVSPEVLLVAMAAQTAIRAEALAPDGPVLRLITLTDAGDDPAAEMWPLLALRPSLAAHDTVVLRPLLGDHEGTVPYLRSLLHSVHRALTDGSVPGLAGAVRDALEDHASAEDPVLALALLDDLAEPDECGCGLMERRPYVALADGISTLVPAVADATAFLATGDVGSEGWVDVRDATLAALLAGRPD